MERQCGRGVEDVGVGGHGVRQWWWIEEHVFFRDNVRDRGHRRFDLDPDDDPGKKNECVCCCVGGDRHEGHAASKVESPSPRPRVPANRLEHWITHLEGASIHTASLD